MTISPFEHTGATPDRRPSGAPARRLRAAADPAPQRPNPLCGGCGREATQVKERIAMNGLWLLPGPDGPVVRRFAHFPGCTPAPPFTLVTCRLCGDGPLLAGDLATGAATTDAPTVADLPDAAREWLTAQGWDLPTGVDLESVICPDHTPRRRAPRA